ncbi:MAG: winged helix-turn-helix transcriptional regulator [Nanoarchaeota archaeon]
MINLDKKDLKILSEIDKNSRRTDSEIAKKVGLSKQVVNYRIQRFIDNKLITDFYTLVNVGKLGLNSYYVFLQLEKINKEQEKTLLRKLGLLGYVGWLVGGIGRWDVILLIYADSISTFDKLLTETINLCGEHVHEYAFTTLIEAEHISYKFLDTSNNIYNVKQTEKIHINDLDDIDKKILKVISQNARMSIVDISKKIKKPVNITNYHLKRLIKAKIIEGFKPKININKLGYQWHLLLLQLQNLSEQRKKQFIEFCKQNKKIYYITNTIGNYNVMLDLHVKSSEEFKEVLLELKDKFSDIIKLYESMVIFDEYKIDYVPKTFI